MVSITVIGRSRARFAIRVLLSTLMFGMVSASLVYAQDPKQGSCQASNALSVLVQGKNVLAYISKGAWHPAVPTTGIGVVNLEGNSVTPTRIPTPGKVNSCASNSDTGQTVCTANDTSDVYLLSGTTLKSTMKSSATGMAMFLEGNCANCGVVMDPVHNRAVIGLNLSNSPRAAGFQLLDLGTKPGFETAFASQAPDTDGSGARQISAGFLIDPYRNLILSPNAHNNYEIITLPDNDHDTDFGNHGDDHDSDSGDHDDNQKNPSGKPAFFEKDPGFSSFGSAGEDCNTGIILASLQEQDPSQLWLADLDQAKATPGSPAGTWTVVSRVQTLTESHLSHGANGIAIAQGTNTGIVTGEFGFDGTGANITAVALKKGDDHAAPQISDWVTCSIPGGFLTGLDPHTVGAYKSPQGGDAMGLVGNFDMNTLTYNKIAVVDLTKMLKDDIVPRTKGAGLGHACASTFLSTVGRDAVVTFVSVP
jgi:hypothetical protein